MNVNIRGWKYKLSLKLLTKIYLIYSQKCSISSKTFCSNIFGKNSVNIE